MKNNRAQKKIKQTEEQPQGISYGLLGIIGTNQQDIKKNGQQRGQKNGGGDGECNSAKLHDNLNF